MQNLADEEYNDEVWGHFDQYNDVIVKIEQLIGEVGRNFVFDGNFNGTIDDDKLRHSSSRFRDEGLMMTGFRGSRIGPVMNGLGMVETGLILAIRFSRHGDNALSICQSLMDKVGYGLQPGLKNKIDGLVMLDRGYHTPSVIKFFSDIHCGFLGTHSEKIGNWPFCTSSQNDMKANQKFISTDGARCSYINERKINQQHTYAILYRSGCKGIGSIHTSVPDHDVWVMENYKNTSSDLATAALVLEWKESIFQLTSVQAQSPWFELRMGLLTGTTAKNLIRCLKFRLLSEFGDNFKGLLNIWGVTCKNPDENKVLELSTSKRKAAYKALGYFGNATASEMVASIVSQYPGQTLVLQKLIQSWCMTPVKSKGSSTQNCFRLGKLAEPEVYKRFGDFLHQYTSGNMVVDAQFEVGLIRYNGAPKSSAVSPDGICCITCYTSNNSTESNKLFDLLSLSNHAAINKESRCIQFICALEIKHKSSPVTENKTRNILSRQLHGKRVKVLNLANDGNEQRSARVV